MASRLWVQGRGFRISGLGIMAEDVGLMIPIPGPAAILNPQS